MVKKNTYWFMPKRYGYGLVPISWEGWLVTALFTAVLLLGGLPMLTLLKPEGLGAIVFIVWVTIASTALLHIAKPYTKGDVRWNWGNKK